MLAQSDNPIPELRETVMRALQASAQDIIDQQNPAELCAALEEEGAASHKHLSALLSLLYCEQDPDEAWKSLGMGVRGDIVWVSLGTTQVIKRTSPEGTPIYIVNGALAINMKHPEVELGHRGQYLMLEPPPMDAISEPEDIGEEFT